MIPKRSPFVLSLFSFFVGGTVFPDVWILFVNERRRNHSMSKSEDDHLFSKGTIHQELLDILCCPETKQAVSLIDPQLLGRLNSLVDKGELCNTAGQAIKEQLDGGLIREDQKIVYPIREQIPVMLIEEGIPIGKGD